ncbi:MAG: endoglucanase [Actinobacteria bacterium 13_2_20CM_2_72_6]|nr:MAG: endoglucanase [Actinobacteria bacterium 13_2_20CM_2_72_6]
MPKHARRRPRHRRRIRLAVPLLVALLAAIPADPVAPAPGCTIGPKLVPTCHVLWGAAAGGFGPVRREEAVRTWEAASGRPTSIYHVYHRGDEAFPTPAEVAMAHDPEHPRLLMVNWRVDLGTTWARVAAGGADARVDREAARLRAFHEPFFLVLHHEPENDVDPRAGSGTTAKDFAAMYRYVVRRLRAEGVTNAVTVVAYMNYERWFTAPWWPDLYPGDDVVDWIGLDSYLDAQPGGFHSGDFVSMVNRRAGTRFPGFYAWATARRPAKPLMLAEWGVYGRPADKPHVFATVLPALPRLPAIKAMVYFDTARDQAGRDIRIDSSPAALAEFQQLAAAALFDVRVR